MTYTVCTYVHVQYIEGVLYIAATQDERSIPSLATGRVCTCIASPSVDKIVKIYYRGELFEGLAGHLLHTKREILCATKFILNFVCTYMSSFVLCFGDHRWPCRFSRTASSLVGHFKRHWLITSSRLSSIIFCFSRVASRLPTSPCTSVSSTPFLAWARAVQVPP